MGLSAINVKTSYSILSSLNQINKLVNTAKSYGYTSLAITDTNNMFGVMEFYLECKKNNIKPIIGIELEVEEKKILLYAKNNNGYKNIVKLATIISERNITKDDLILFKKDIILIMPFLFYDEDIYNIFDDSYVGYESNEEKENITKNKIYLNEVLYINKSDYKYLDYVYMIKDSKVLGEYELNTHKAKYLYTKDDYNENISLEEQKVINKVVESCNVEINYTKGLLPIYDSNINAYDYLTTLCNKGLNKRLNNNVSKEYQDRLNYELNIINQMGFCNYFLIVWDYVKYAKFNNILVGPGRGSAAGSLVSYTLGITDIDPLKYNLLFERFLNPERITMPDIDIDFDATRRNEVIEYVTNKYGSKKVVGIITFNTLGAKQVIRDVARVLNINLRLVDEITKMIDINDTLKDCLNKTNFKRLISSSENLKKLYDIAINLEGLPRHISIHAAGIIISSVDIDEVIPLYKNQIGMYTTAYSMNYLEDLGLLKMDFLGLSNLTLIDEVISNIKEKENLNITFSNIPIDDAKTYKVFEYVNTEGIFQFESVGMKKFLAKFHITSMEDIIAAIALFRPGPMDNIDTYIKRKEGKEKIDYIDPSLENILKPTYGIIIYQEQIMQIAQVLASYTLAEADLLRRAMSKKKEEILVNEKTKFIEKCMKNGHSKEVSIKVYDLILKFANYGFNRSHSVAYAIIAYKMAFLKTYFFKYFMTSLLTNSIGSEIKLKKYIQEIRQNNIKILLPSINMSTNKYISSNDGILCPLSIIKNVGTVISNVIIKEREKKEFIDYYDFITRMYKQGINAKILISLINASCFREFGYNRKTLVNNIESISNYAELAQNEGLIEIEKPEIIIYPEYSKEELINNEFNVFGFYLSEHPISKYKNTNDLSLLNIELYFDRSIEIILLIERIKEITTKNNDIMAFVNAVDEYKEISLTLFPDTYKQYNDIKANDIIKIRGRVEKRFDKYQIVVNKLEVLNR